MLKIGVSVDCGTMYNRYIIKSDQELRTCPLLFKDDPPYLLHGFRNKYFDKISLGNMLYFHN